MNRQELEELFNLCMDIREGKTPMVVFYHYSGHIDDLDVIVCASESDYKNKILDYGITSGMTKKELFNQLREIHTHKDDMDWYRENVVKSSIKKYILEYKKLRELGVCKSKAIKSVISNIKDNELAKIVKGELLKL